MHHDVASLWNFYYDSPLGRVAQRSLQHTLRGLWPDVKRQTVAGYGFAAPLLRPFMAEATRTLCLMPARQGVMHWPADGPNTATLVEAGRWPVPNGFIDRLIVAHAIESEPHLDMLLEEIGRVLAPEGRVIIIASNRSGIWARADSTPFGIGRTFSFGQLERLLASHELDPVTRAAALYSPPSKRGFWLRSANALERFGLKLDARRVAGAIVVEATKHVYALPKGNAKESTSLAFHPLGVRRPRPVGATSNDGMASRLKSPATRSRKPPQNGGEQNHG